MGSWKLVVCAALVCGLAACNGESGETGTTSGTPQDANEVRIDTSTYKMGPGEEKNYYCFTARLPADKETIIEEIAPIYGKATHHLGIYYTLSPEPDGAFDCPELVRSNWIPLYGGGVESGTLKMPEGAGFRLPKNQQVLIQLHLLNASGAAVEDKASIVFKTTDKQDVVKAGMFGFDNRDITIPPQSQDVMQSMSCSPVGRDMDVFAVFGHMHQRGKRIEVSRGATPGAEILYETSTWNFDNQPTIPRSFHVSASDSIHLRCWYDNPSTKAMGYGESTFDEMCSFVFYYAPYEQLDGCVVEPPQ